MGVMQRDLRQQAANKREKTLSYSFEDVENRKARMTAVIWLTLACVAGVIVSILLQGVDTALTKENGGAEWMSVIAMLVIAVWLVAIGTLKTRFWMVPVTFLILALRERDGHNWFYDPGFLRAETLSGDNPLWQKALTAAAILCVLVTVLLLLWRGIMPLLRAVLHLRAWTLAFALAGFAAVYAQMVDGSGKKLAQFGIEVSAQVARILPMTEELGELVFALGLVWAVALFRPVPSNR